MMLSSKYVTWVLIAGLLLVNSIGSTLLLAGIILFAITTLFSFITLPVEVDASRRAIAWLEGSSLAGSMEMGKAKDALNWAGYTYVAAALGSLSTLIYYIMLYMARR